eukprot:GFKZ01003064.1.p1 GENE.GFKZ01003064.1~~GFKZ01003064.1.p1  ORF type:complete len:120 (-),score=22.12 GFKZ01003064.1:43-402(-)
MESADGKWLQEMLAQQQLSDSDEGSYLSGSDQNVEIGAAEVAALAPKVRAYNSNSVNNCSSSVIEDIENRLFCDFDCERYGGDLHGTINPESEENNTSEIPQEELLAKSASHQNGSLPQ